MLGLIWIQTAWHSAGIPDRIFWILEKSDDKKMQITQIVKS